MKKNFKFISLILCIILCAPLLSSCSLKAMDYSGGTLAVGRVGTVYRQSVDTAEGPASVTYEILSGNLPSGLNFSEDGIISGTPTAVSNSTFTIAAKADGYEDAEAEFSISISEGVISYSGSALAGGKIGEAYSASVATATGSSSITYALKNSTLPQGLDLSPAGIISGIPSANGLVSFTVVASASGFGNAETAFSINIDRQTLAYQGSVLASGKVGLSYNQSVAKVTVPSDGVTYAVKSGSPLPSGLFLNGGYITGTAETAGEFKFVIIANASGYNSAEAEFSIIIAPILQYEGRTLAAGKIGQAYTRSIAFAAATVTGVQPAITYLHKSGNLPIGLNLTGSNIVGTPEAAGDYNFVITASAEGYTSVDASFYVTVSDKDALSYEGSMLAGGKINQTYSANVGTATAESGAPVISYDLKTGSNLPSGLGINKSTGEISGTPSAVGTFTFTIVASAENYISAEALFSIAISNLGTITYSGFALTDGVKEEAYLSQLIHTATAPGNPSIQYAVSGSSSLPGGLVLNPEGTISGTPTVDGDFTIVIIASSANYTSGSATFSIKIEPPASLVKTTYVYEAEYAHNLLEQVGKSASGDTEGDGMIIPGTIGAGGETASNGYFLSYLYNPGLFLEFKINSDKAVTDATFAIRLSAEYDMILSSQSSDALHWSPTEPAGFEVKVNDAVIEYSNITLSGRTMLDGEIIPFRDFVLTATLSLKAGENVVRLTVKNNMEITGTMWATAPMFDCFKITTDAILTWTPSIGNLDIFG